MSDYSGAFDALSRKPAVNVAPSAKSDAGLVAILIPGTAKAVIPDGEVIPVGAAEKIGFSLAISDGEVLAALDASTPRVKYIHSIRSLPEAVGRPGAVARIIAAHNETSMPAARAAVFLAGLPEERPEAEAQPAGDPLAHRVALAFEAATVRGDTVRADKLKAAVAMHRDHGTSLARALEIFTFDPRTI